MLVLPDALDQVNHVEAHLDRVVGMEPVCMGHSGYTVVAVSKDLDPHAVVFLSGGDLMISARASIGSQRPGHRRRSCHIKL